MPISNPPPLTLSSLIIDVAKDWGGYDINNLGDINIGTNFLRTANLLLREEDIEWMHLMNAANTIKKSLRVMHISAEGTVHLDGDPSRIQPLNIDGKYTVLQARDTGVGMVEIARLQGAAEPRFKYTLPAQMYRDAGDYGGNFSTYTPPVGVEGDMIVAEDTNVGAPGRRIYVYSGGAWRYVDLT